MIGISLSEVLNDELGVSGVINNSLIHLCWDWNSAKSASMKEEPQFQVLYMRG